MCHDVHHWQVPAQPIFCIVAFLNKQIPLLSLSQKLSKTNCPYCQTGNLVVRINTLRNNKFLGCSHYPYLIPLLKKLLPKNVCIIDSGEAIARQTKNVLEKNNIVSISKEKPKLQFYSNSEVKTLQLFLKKYSSNISINKKVF